jgi:hypothetical protein
MKLENHLGLAPLAASVIRSGSASAKPAQCFHSVDGKTNIDNRFRKGWQLHDRCWRNFAK